MIEVADVFRRFAADYLSAHGASMLPSHRRAIEDILNCRTAALGGQVWRCDTCDTEMFSYHSCNNRSCPKCHTAQIQKWLEHRQAEMLPVPYFHITVTVPAELREVLRANQRDGYGVLMQASAAAIIELARDPGYVGGTVAVLAVLHTWTQQLNLHPHVHCLVSGGGSSCSPSRLLPNWCAASFARCCAESVLISSSQRRCGAGPGSSMSPPGATANRRCSTISPATSFASLSPTRASSASTRKRSPSNTRTARPAARKPADSAAKSSCAASSSMCCRAASTRSVTSVCGIPCSATTPRGCARCCNCRRRSSLSRRRTPSMHRLNRLTQNRCHRLSR